ncbi:hypothetical protein TruAng_000864 [Truncatella angustata]|nr:hypothetical protein TruAng_000864 [Truncatella angustata]
MAILNQELVGGALAVARVIARQTSDAATSTVSSAVSSALNTAASSALSSITSPASSTSAPSTTSTAPEATSSTNNSGGNSGGSGTSSPLLFFVALGFGVVFTNLWIIVGVKYCFRYNARNRQMRGLDENGEPINLENMPTRPHRRRREKKLMTMDEVNDKFPMMKYKTWVADRTKDGLPTAGGISAPASRANSVRSVEGIVPEVSAKERDSIEDPATAGDKSKTGTKDGVATNNGADNDNTLTQTQTAGSIITKDPDRAHASDDEDDDDHINAAVPPELLSSSGDTCAICIDTLEDDDDVRGLTCGHAFHAVCLDPWLTNRRACCPLCKADYYTPKPRPPPADGDTTNSTASNPGDASRNNGRMNMPRQPQRTIAGFSLRNSGILGRYGNTTNVDSYGRPRRSEHDRRHQTNSRITSRANSRATRTAATPAQGQQQQAGFLSRVRGRFPTFGRSAGSPEAGTNNAETTPSQLEAGARTTS